LTRPSHSLLGLATVLHADVSRVRVPPQGHFPLAARDLTDRQDRFGTNADIRANLNEVAAAEDEATHLFWDVPLYQPAGVVESEIHQSPPTRSPESVKVEADESPIRYGNALGPRPKLGETTGHQKNETPPGGVDEGRFRGDRGEFRAHRFMAK
jgi:hypothetical protein